MEDRISENDVRRVVPPGMNFAPPGQGAEALVINTPTREALLADIETRLGGGRGFAVATLNLDHVVKLRRSPAFHAAYAAHSHVVADGNPIVWFSRMAGQDVGLVPGSELIEPVAALAARTGAPVGLFGSTPETLDLAAARLAARHPGLEVAARIAPPHGFDPAGPAADACIAEMGQSAARVWFLALGAPKQEIFAIRAWQRLPQAGFLSIGAGLDFIAGHQKRAPGLVRSLKAEWLWRMGTDPVRLAPRYARCVAVMPGLARRAMHSRRTAPAAREQ
ncbi:WecB/TagA/CpsF family glycosyltransferase [Tropicimonas sp.]|uniref:WecB/TagA/CpsF family glycosyltransferase n=1 Tax=Tropicimonas sp. TaxID=2067044 RepID=UPI003A8AAF6E